MPISKFSIIILITIFSVFLTPQQTCGQVNLDSLWNVWNDSNQPDMDRLEALQELTDEGYLYSQPDSAYFFADLQYNFAKKRGLKKQMSEALNTQGLSFWLRGDYEKGLNHFRRSLTIYKEIEFRYGEAGALNNIGIIYSVRGDYKDAFEYYERALNIYILLKDKEGIARGLNNLGLIYKVEGNFVKAIENFTKSRIIKEEIGDKHGIIKLNNNIHFCTAGMIDIASNLRCYCG